MNKDPVSWIHYALITITASVLAYVTIVEPSENETSSALDMLPELYDKNNDISEIQEEEQPMEIQEEEQPMEIQEEEQPMETQEEEKPMETQEEEQPMETINTEIPTAVAQPVYRGGKLKKTKNKYNNINRNRTRNKRS